MQISIVISPGITSHYNILYDHENKNNNEMPFNFVSLFYLLSPLYQNFIYSAFIRKGTIFDTLLFVRVPRAQKRMGIECAGQIEIRIVHSLPRNPRDRKSTACPTYTRRRRIKCPIHFIWSARMAPSARWRCVFRPKRARTEEKGEPPEGWFALKTLPVRIGSRGFSPLGIRRGLDCISRHTYRFTDTFA